MRLGALVSAHAAAGGTVSYQVPEQPACWQSVVDMAACEAACTEGACDVVANPPHCTGSLVVACAGPCTAKSGESLWCDGKCDGTCSGECTAPSGVHCAGSCEGLCRGVAEGGVGAGIQDDGTCQGTCDGTCALTAAGAECDGLCSGECDGTCKGTAAAPVSCTGECSAGGDPLWCSFGKLRGGCGAESCGASCRTISEANADCRPHPIAVSITGATDPLGATRLERALGDNVGVLLMLAELVKPKALALTDPSHDLFLDARPACLPLLQAAHDGASADRQSMGVALAHIQGALVALKSGS